jgi:ComF family protein
VIRNIFHGFLNFVLPETCLSCAEPVDEGFRYLCGKCRAKLEPYGQVHPWQKEYIESGIIDNSYSAFWFREGTSIQPLLHALKYQKIKSAGKMLGEEIGKYIALTGVKFDYIIPVPLHKAKLRERTYNQSRFIAEGIACITGIALTDDTIRRTRFTGTQTKLNKAERKQNVLNAFEVVPAAAGKLRGKNIIIADDVITTGATILECAAVVKKAGADKLWICSAAYAELKQGIS